MAHAVGMVMFRNGEKLASGTETTLRTWAYAVSPQHVRVVADFKAPGEKVRLVRFVDHRLAVVEFADKLQAPVLVDDLFSARPLVQRDSLAGRREALAKQGYRYSSSKGRWIKRKGR